MTPLTFLTASVRAEVADARAATIKSWRCAAEGASARESANRALESLKRIDDLCSAIEQHASQDSRDTLPAPAMTAAEEETRP